MKALLKEIRHNPMLWLLVFVPAVLVANKVKPEAHTFLFVLSVLAIVPLAALLSHATESVAAKTGDAIGGLLNATLGNLTELVIAVAALRAGEYMLVKASIAGAIVTNTLFMLSMSFLLGGLKHHVQEYNRIGARLQASLLFLATVALLIPSAVSRAQSDGGATFTRKLSAGLAVLLLLTYALGMLFSLKTHREFFGSREDKEGDETKDVELRGLLSPALSSKGGEGEAAAAQPGHEEGGEKGLLSPAVPKSSSHRGSVRGSKGGEGGAAAAHRGHEEEEGEAPWPIGLAVGTLAAVTVLVALVSEVFVESVQKAAESFGMTPAFVGFIVVSLVGGAAEMASAFGSARKDRLDMSVGIALGSASQIALFVAPVLVLLS